MKYKLFSLLFSFINCFLIIPLRYLPIYKINSSTHSDIFNSIINTKLYAKIELGIPKQNIEIPLDFDSNDFYISDINLKNINSKGELNPDIKYYDSSKSISLFPLEDIYLDGNNFYLGEYSKEIFYFNQTKYELEFYLPRTLKKQESGGIGLLLNRFNYNSDRAFLKILKKKGIIENYYLNIFYNNDNIFLFIGKLPHEINSAIYKELKIDNNLEFEKDEINILNMEIDKGIIKNIINIDKILIINENENIYNFNFIKKIELNYHLGGINAPNNLLPIYKNMFAEYISKKQCFKEQLNIPKNLYFFYCFNDDIILNKIQKNFYSIEFYNKELNYNFTLEFDDLYYIKGNYIYFLIFFDANNEIDINKIIVGKPFIKKYQFSFEPDKRLLFFYKKKNKERKNDIENNNEMNFNNKINIIILLIAIISIFISFFVSLKFYFNKKKAKNKAYELDDEYVYIQKNDKKFIINDN